MHQFDFFVFDDSEPNPATWDINKTAAHTWERINKCTKFLASNPSEHILHISSCIKDVFLPLEQPHHTHLHPSTTHVLSALVPTRFHRLLPSQQRNTPGPPETQLQPAACPQAEASKQGHPAHRSRKTPTEPDQSAHSQNSPLKRMLPLRGLTRFNLTQTSEYHTNLVQFVLLRTI